MVQFAMKNMCFFCVLFIIPPQYTTNKYMSTELVFIDDSSICTCKNRKNKRKICQNVYL